MAQTVRVEGLRELEKKLKALADEFGGKTAIKPVRSALRKAARVVQKDAQARVQVKTGALKDNIIVYRPRDRRGGIEAINVSVRAKAKVRKANRRNARRIASGEVQAGYMDYGPLYYARFLEFGTSRMRPYPFLRPAFEANKSQLPNIIRDELALAIQKAVAKLKG